VNVNAPVYQKILFSDSFYRAIFIARICVFVLPISVNKACEFFYCKMCVSPSVYPSVTLWFCVKTSEHDVEIISSFDMQKSQNPCTSSAMFVSDSWASCYNL